MPDASDKQPTLLNALQMLVETGERPKVKPLSEYRDELAANPPMDELLQQARDTAEEAYKPIFEALSSELDAAEDNDDNSRVRTVARTLKKYRSSFEKAMAYLESTALFNCLAKRWHDAVHECWDDAVHERQPQPSASDERAVSNFTGFLKSPRFVQVVHDYIDQEVRDFAGPDLKERIDAAVKKVMSEADGTVVASEQTEPPSGDAGEGVTPDNAGGNNSEGKRKCYNRDHAFLELYEAKGSETYHKPAKIRDLWNRNNEGEESIADGKQGIDTVKKGIGTARSERKEEQNKRQS